MSLKKFFLIVGLNYLGAAYFACNVANAEPSAKKEEAAPVEQLSFEKIDFDSLETTGFFSPKPVKINGFLLKVKRAGASPGAVLSPACNGLLLPGGDQIKPQYRKMAKFLNEKGITVLLVDGFNPRGSQEICTQSAKKRTISTSTRLKDSLGGLVYLRGRNDVMPGKIFLVTWGAAGSFQAMNEPVLHEEKIGTGFAAAILFYPECDHVGNRFAPYAPIQMFVGDMDTWNSAAACLALAKRQTPGSASFDTKIYPNTYHAFDQPRLPTLMTGMAVGPVMTGGNPESAEDAYKTTAAFLSRFIDVGGVKAR